MWIFTPRSFFTVTQNKEDATLLHVRGRVKGDIERYFPTEAVEHTPNADYLYRTNVPRQLAVDVMAKIARDVTYTSFKGNLEDARRRPYYLEVWNAMATMQFDFQNELENSR